ncbi:MAG: DUF3696 domain-containing protein [Ignavibacteria bacterium]|nr:DUF3696 domain-containing protein [Ignavibacteria bacterium]
MDQIKFSDIVKLHNISRHTLKKIEDRKIIYSKFIEINYKLISNFNIHLIYCIKKDNKTGEIFLKNKENNKIPFSNSSSGFIQLFPVIVLCSFFKGFITKDLEIFFPYFPKSTYHTSVFFENLDNDVYFSTLLTEQPELHLHPKLQSELAILFADTINKTSGYGNMIIETHSEHLIRKIQVLIARGELDRSRLSVQYFNNENGITKVETMEIDEHGLFVKDWPNGFFDDSVNLTMELYEAIREIKKRKINMYLQEIVISPDIFEKISRAFSENYDEDIDLKSYKENLNLKKILFDDVANGESIIFKEIKNIISNSTGFGRQKIDSVLKIFLKEGRCEYREIRNSKKYCKDDVLNKVINLCVLSESNIVNSENKSLNLLKIKNQDLEEIEVLNFEELIKPEFNSRNYCNSKQLKIERGNKFNFEEYFKPYLCETKK